MPIFIETTGSIPTITLNDLPVAPKQPLVLTHPQSFDTTGIFLIDDLYDSDDLRDAIVNGYVVLSDGTSTIDQNILSNESLSVSIQNSSRGTFGGWIAPSGGEVFWDTNKYTRKLVTDFDGYVSNPIPIQAINGAGVIEPSASGNTISFDSSGALNIHGFLFIDIEGLYSSRSTNFYVRFSTNQSETHIPTAGFYLARFPHRLMIPIEYNTFLEEGEPIALDIFTFTRYYGQGDVNEDETLRRSEKIAQLRRRFRYSFPTTQQSLNLNFVQSND